MCLAACLLHPMLTLPCGSEAAQAWAVNVSVPFGGWGWESDATYYMA